MQKKFFFTHVKTCIFINLNEQTPWKISEVNLVNNLFSNLISKRKWVIANKNSRIDPVLTFLLRPFIAHAPKIFYLVSNLFTLSGHDEGYYRNAPCTLHLMLRFYCIVSIKNDENQMMNILVWAMHHICTY